MNERFEYWLPVYNEYNNRKIKRNEFLFEQKFKKLSL